MIYPSIDKLLNIIDSKYTLVKIAAERSREIAETGFTQMPEKMYHSKTTLGKALEEVAENLIQLK